MRPIDADAIEYWTDGWGCDTVYRDEIDKIPTLKPKWHNFKDEKPTKDGLYIVYADGLLWGSPVVCQAEYYGGEWIWYEMADDYYITSMVSHWMPLPEPPEVEHGSD